MESTDAVEHGEAWRQRLRDQFPELVRRHRDKVYRVSLRIVGEPQRAEELTQDAFERALMKLDDFEGRSAFSTWVCGIAKHLALNASRKRGELLVEDGILDPHDDALEALARLRRQEREELMRQASVDMLDPYEQELVYLRHVEGMPRAQIAEVLGRESADRVRKDLYRCQRRLKKGITQRLEQLGHGTSFIRTSW